MDLYKFKSHSHNRNRKKFLFNRIFSYFLYLISLVLLFSFLINIYYVSLLQTKTINNYRNNLNSLSNIIDTSLYEIIQTTSLMESSNFLFDIFHNKNALPLEDFVEVSKSTTMLMRFRTTKSYINNAYIINEANNIVISSNGTLNISEFFDFNNTYDRYDKNFWLNLNDKRNAYVILQSSNVKKFSSHSEVEVIPIVQFTINGNKIINKIVVEINKSYILNLLNDNKLTENSILLAYNNVNGEVIESNNSKPIELDNEALTGILTNNSFSYTFKHNNVRYLTIKYKDEKSTIGDYTYIALVPYIDFVKESIKTLTVPILIICISILFAVLMSFLFSKKIYNPINNIVNILNQGNIDIKNSLKGNDEIDFLNQEINKIITDNRKLTNDLSAAIPYVCERYLLSVLNNNLIFPENEVANFSKYYNFLFQYDYFEVIIINVDYTKSFYENYSKEDHRKIYSNILSAAKEIFSDDYLNYVLSVGKNQICVILNIEDSNNELDIISYMKTFHNKINIDKDLIILYSGIGKIHNELIGLHKSYQEALKASSFSFPITNQTIKLYEDENSQTSFSYTIDEENKFFNYLLKGDKVKATAIFEAVIKKNVYNNISEIYLKELYAQIHNTCTRVLNLKNISPYDLLGEDYIDIIPNVKDLTIKDLHKYVELLFESVISINYKAKNQSIDANALKEYLEKNYREDMYLDKIADDFNVSSNSISKLLKKALGMPFQSYMSRLRIYKSKELLCKTNKSIDAIALEVGFNSRHTFIRMFKLLEGVTPSEYRNSIN